jgi:glucose-1-phosphate adenylyltransferase
VRPYLFDGYWADVGTIDSFYEANVSLGKPEAPFRLLGPLRPIYTHLGHLPGARLFDCHVRESIVSDGCDLHRCAVDQSVIGPPDTHRRRLAHRRVGHSRRGLLRGRSAGEEAALGIGRDVVLRRTIVDKNARIGDGARLVNEKGVDQFDGRGLLQSAAESSSCPRAG